MKLNTLQNCKKAVVGKEILSNVMKHNQILIKQCKSMQWPAYT